MSPAKLNVNPSSEKEGGSMGEGRIGCAMIIYCIMARKIVFGGLLRILTIILKHLMSC